MCFVTARGGSPLIFLLPASDRLLISERNVPYLGLHTSFAAHKNKTSCAVSGANRHRVLFFFQQAGFGLDDLIAGTLEALMGAIKR